MTSIPIIDGNSTQYYYSRHNKNLYRKHGGARKWHNSYNDILRKVAKEENVKLIDNYQNIIKKAKGDTDRILQRSGYIDFSGTHFTPTGADIIYHGVNKALR